MTVGPTAQASLEERLLAVRQTLTLIHAATEGDARVFEDADLRGSVAKLAAHAIEILGQPHETLAALPTGPAARRGPDQAPAGVRILIQAASMVDRQIIDAAWSYAGELLARDAFPSDEGDSLYLFIEEHGTATLEAYAPELRASHLYQRDSGTVHGAFGAPAFALGFTLAYRIFAEAPTVPGAEAGRQRGGAR